MKNMTFLLWKCSNSISNSCWRNWHSWTYKLIISWMIQWILAWNKPHGSLRKFIKRFCFTYDRADMDPYHLALHVLSLSSSRSSFKNDWPFWNEYIKWQTSIQGSSSYICFTFGKHLQHHSRLRSLSWWQKGEAGRWPIRGERPIHHPRRDAKTDGMWLGPPLSQNQRNLHTSAEQTMNRGTKTGSQVHRGMRKNGWWGGGR